MKKRRFLKQLTKWIGVAGIVVLILPKLIIWFTTREMIQDKTGLEPRLVAVVFGAGLWRDGSPTPVLRDRIETAADLYFSGKVAKLLMSGDNRFVDYNEPAAMMTYARGLGVPVEDIVLDYAGRSTYDTCYRAREIFQVEQPVLVTQKFHLPRALFICKSIGLDAVGVDADKRTYRQSTRSMWEVREFFASIKALWDVYVERPLPVLGDPEPIVVNLVEGE